ncbi:hypothetical protein GCM10023220_63350 [Streptomyces ziwulingensis]|uniref:DNA primase n=1 Tax=Streptomyces ziwulingensis TaxID=1045501 RepID=A0ABP9CY70_9ACTN
MGPQAAELLPAEVLVLDGFESEDDDFAPEEEAESEDDLESEDAGFDDDVAGELLVEEPRLSLR